MLNNQEVQVGAVEEETGITELWQGQYLHRLECLNAIAATVSSNNICMNYEILHKIVHFLYVQTQSKENEEASKAVNFGLFAKNNKIFTGNKNEEKVQTRNSPGLV